MVELIDDQIAMILSALETRHLLDNTYVIFTVDHGEMLGDHGLWAKNVAYEPALRVPLVLAGPGIEAGAVFDGLVELIDVGATIRELAGLPASDDLDARSVAPILRGESSQHRSDTIAGERNFRCIRTRQHKLIQNCNDIDELYDLEQDPFELENIALSKPELVSTLRHRMVQRFGEGKWLR
jgi:choline-sulfatase